MCEPVNFKNIDMIFDKSKGICPTTSSSFTTATASSLCSFFSSVIHEYLLPRAGDTEGEGGDHGHPTFLRSKKKKGKQRKKRKSLKVETIKRLSQRSKCYCFSHSRVPRNQKIFLSANYGGRQYFPLFHVPSTLKPISPALLPRTGSEFCL